MSEVKLYTSERERERLESLAEVYSIIVTIDQVEKAYIRDSISQQDYTQACSRLLAQYQTLLKDRQLEADFGSLDEFRAKYKMDQSSGIQRVRVGIPATAETVGTSTPIQEGTPSATPAPGVSAKAVSEITGLFITAMDGLKLNFRAKDQLHPLFSDLVTSLNKVTSGDFDGRGKLVQWLITLNKMKIDDELTDEQARQCLFDLEGAYKSFYSSLA